MSETLSAVEAACYRAVTRYCRAVDRLDWVGVRSVYTADGVDHHTGFDGSADDYVIWIRGRLGQFDGTMHLVGNHLVELIDKDQAISETYGTATHWGKPASDAAVNFTSGFRYVDHFRRVDGRWLIEERFAVREWTRSDAGTMIPPEGPGPRGRRDGGDPLDRLRVKLIREPEQF